MREIKFRAWDGIVMRYSWDGWNSESDILAEVWEYAQKDYDAKVMQYTGLKDKNGKEIYESDILESDGVKWIVYWNVNGHWGYKRIKDGSCFTVDYWECEVIGNIYENPELLDGD